MKKSELRQLIREEIENFHRGAMERQVDNLVTKKGYEGALKIVNNTILEKEYSSTKNYWVELKKLLIQKYSNKKQN